VRRITSCKENDDRRWRRLESATHWRDAVAPDSAGIMSFYPKENFGALTPQNVRNLTFKSVHLVHFWPAEDILFSSCSITIIMYSSIAMEISRGPITHTPTDRLDTLTHFEPLHKPLYALVNDMANSHNCSVVNLESVESSSLSLDAPRRPIFKSLSLSSSLESA